VRGNSGQKKEEERADGGVSAHAAIMNPFGDRRSGRKSGVRGQGSGIRDRGSGIRIRDQGSGIRDQGRWGFRDVILELVTTHTPYLS
jgi:hypothetical protein